MCLVQGPNLGKPAIPFIASQGLPNSVANQLHEWHFGKPRISQLTFGFCGLLLFESRTYF